MPRSTKTVAWRVALDRSTTMAVVLVASLAWLSSSEARQPRAADSPIWEAAIEKFEAQDREKPPPKNGILFIGGSNIRRWNLADNFADLPVINRGFGGSMIAEAIYYADRIVLPYRPRIIVLYGGANDMSRGRKTPEQVAADYREFVAKVQAALPDTRIVYISLPHFYRDRNDPKSSGKVSRVHELIRAACGQDKRRVYLDVTQAMADENGSPRRDLFVPDGIHMNAAGYKLWAELLRPHLRVE